jgi:hypothetical protein
MLIYCCISKTAISAEEAFYNMMDILYVTSGLDVSRLSKSAMSLINSIKDWIAIDVNTILWVL